MVVTLSKSIRGSDRAYTNGVPVTFELSVVGLMRRTLLSEVNIYRAVVIASPANERFSVIGNEGVNRSTCCGVLQPSAFWYKEGLGSYVQSHFSWQPYFAKPVCQRN